MASEQHDDLPPEIAAHFDGDDHSPFPGDPSGVDLGRVDQASLVTPDTPLIASATVSKTQVCSGESVRVEVATNRASTVVIDRMLAPSSTRWLQITGTKGTTHSIDVTAMEPQPGARPRSESRTLSVAIADCGALPSVRPIFSIATGMDSLAPIKFTVSNPDDLDAIGYYWSFGDGTTETTKYPAVDHTYSLSKLAYDTQFEVTVTAVRAAGNTSALKSLVIRMPQAIALMTKGVVQPFLSSAYRDQAGNHHLAIYNHTNTPMTFKNIVYRYVSCKPGVDPSAKSQQTIPAFTLNARSSTTWRIGGLEDFPPSNMHPLCGLQGWLNGTTSTGQPVEATFTAEIARPAQLTRKVTDSYVRSMLRTADARKLMSPTHTITYAAMNKLARERRLDKFNWTPDLRFTLFAGDSEEECSPGAPATKPGFTCQATDEFLEDLPYLANAYAGDIIESAACGAVGSLLRAVSPAQRYTHVGVMVAHHDRIRHSTAETSRFQDHMKGTAGSDGVEPSVLKYARPGVITQSIYEAYEGSQWKDDEYADAEYLVSGFNRDPARCDTDENLTFPLVVTGDLGHMASRKKVAEAAVAIKGHYRFFAYSNGAISQDSAYRQPGTDLNATVCSTFAWAAVKQAWPSTILEGVVESGDVGLTGAFVDGNTLDGQYYYTAGERANAAKRLYSTIYNKVQNQEFSPCAELNLDADCATIGLDAADNWGNQIVNCFASDSCLTSDKDSTAWESPGEGRTTSPDNILSWDGPLYGRQLPLIWREGMFRRRHVWRAAVGSGTLSGKVTQATGEAASGATVVITGADRAGATDNTGKFSFSAVPGGCHQVVASQVVGGQLVRAQARACITAGQATTVQLTLPSPLLKRRQVTVLGYAHVYDDYPWPGGGNSKDFDVTAVGNVKPESPIQTQTVGQLCEGDEVVARGTTIKFQLLEDGSVDVTLKSKLYEGETCATNDLEGSGSAHVIVARDAQESLYLRIKNSGPGGGDYVAFHLEISNLVDL